MFESVWFGCICMCCQFLMVGDCVVIGDVFGSVSGSSVCVIGEGGVCIVEVYVGRMKLDSRVISSVVLVSIQCLWCQWIGFVLLWWLKDQCEQCLQKWECLCCVLWWMVCLCVVCVICNFLFIMCNFVDICMIGGYYNGYV